MLYGVAADSIPEMIRIENDEGKRNLFRFLCENNCEPSYGQPTLFQTGPDSYLLMSNHQYGFSPLDADAVTGATLEARAELYRQLECPLRSDCGLYRCPRSAADFRALPGDAGGYHVGAAPCGCGLPDAFRC